MDVAADREKALVIDVCAFVFAFSPYSPLCWLFNSEKVTEVSCCFCQQHFV